MVHKIHSKMWPLSCADTNHDETAFEVLETARINKNECFKKETVFCLKGKNPSICFRWYTL